MLSVKDSGRKTVVFRRLYPPSLSATQERLPPRAHVHHTYLHVYHMYISYIVNTYKSFSSLFQAFIRKAFFIEKVCWRFGFFAVGLNGNFWVRPPVTRLNENEHKEK